MTPERAAESDKAMELEKAEKSDKVMESGRIVETTEDGGMEAKDSMDLKKAAEPKKMTQSKAQASSNRQQTSDKPNGSLMSDKESEAFERGKISGLQEAILAIMGKNGPITEQMRRDVMENVYYDSLINWVKSFR